MDKTRTLPPLVRGRVTGVLDFCADEIRLYRNILLMTDSFDFALQVQWWGESLPAIIRPKEIQVQGRTFKNSSSLKSYFHSAKYEIKTTLDLFKLYLNACEVIELCVLETVENYVIGSAFLRNLISIISNNSEFIRLPIFDYLGEGIGEVIIHANFTKKFHDTLKETPELNRSDDLNKFENQDSTNPSIRPSYLSLAKKTLCHNKTPPKEKLCIKIDAQLLEDEEKNKIKRLDSSLSESEKCKCFKEKIIYVSDGENKNKNSQLPEIKTSDDSSKILHFNISSKEYKKKNSFKNSKHKMDNKFNTKSIKCKSKSTKVDSSDCILRDRKPNESFKHLPVHTRKFISTTGTFSDLKSNDIQSNPSKESSSVKVLDYLLGSDMSKDDEEIALSDFKNMSPSHNLVNSISQLYLIPVDNSQACKNKPPASPKSAHFHFDFSNPIERNYYEKFFLKSNSYNDFEICEFLNKPGNSSVLDKFNEANKSQNDLKNIDSRNYTKEEDYIVNINTNNCSRCKYYKKLDELDTIIESLKHFEQKILKHEKDMQSEMNENQITVKKINW